MTGEMTTLILTAITVSFLHTLTGPDHYLPFIALSKARQWSYGKTIGWTVACGIGHVLSSVVIGLGGVAVGWSLSSLGWLEGIRGGLAAWCMFVAGIIYLAYAWRQLRRNRLHKHFEEDENNLYVYEHRHAGAPISVEKHKVTPWVMFIIFLLGPCEPLIPLLSFPAAQQSIAGIATLIIVFSAFTLATMVALVTAGYFGLGLLAVNKMEKYMHVLGAFTILLCGGGMLFLGW
jgi:sulfite exporter TauE/SafE